MKTKTASDPDRLVKKHPDLVHSELRRVTSHVQRRVGDWIINTVMIEGCEAPFRYKRKREYKNIRGARVNLTYYPDVENIGGIQMEIMRVVRIKVA